MRAVVEEVGVAALELLGERESAPAKVVEDERGEAVPELESFFFEEFLESLARASCSCYKFSELRQVSAVEGGGSRGRVRRQWAPKRRGGNVRTTRALKPFMLRVMKRKLSSMLQADGCRGVVIDKDRGGWIDYHIRVDRTSLRGNRGGGFGGGLGLKTEDVMQKVGRVKLIRHGQIDVVWLSGRKRSVGRGCGERIGMEVSRLLCVRESMTASTGRMIEPRLVQWIEAGIGMAVMDER